MNSNWSRLKRKLDENKQNNSNRHKRRRLTPPNTSNTNSKNSKSSNHNQPNHNNHSKPFITKYLNSSSNSNNNNNNNPQSLHSKTETYRKKTPKKQLFETLNLIPPASTNNNMQQRKAFWHDLRLKLRARLPKEFLFKIITPINHPHNSKKSSKLHDINPSTKHTNVMALDCEMVGIGNGNKSVLARISIVNYFGEVVYDKFVTPKHDPKCLKITDYREDITGITKQDLTKFGISFAQCQQEIIELLKGRKVIGHSINNDFAVLKCSNMLKKNFYSTVVVQNGEKLSKRRLRKLLQRKSHQCWFFDTAQCELLHDDMTKPRSLKFLLELYLGIHIQSAEHDSVIDAISTMAVYRAVLPEIGEKSQRKVVEKRRRVDVKKMKVKKEEEERERRDKVRENELIMNNYAYGNELDRLIAQFDGGGGLKDNFDRQLSCSGVYGNGLSDVVRNDEKEDADVTSFLE